MFVTDDRIIEIIKITSIDKLPSYEIISNIPRTKILKLVFVGNCRKELEKIGNRLKEELVGFQIGIHTTTPEIKICKLITDKEIEANQLFFEQCAKDYRNLAENLIFKLALKIKVVIYSKFPLLTFNPLKNTKAQIGQMDEWRYYLHGYHCGFENLKNKQEIEVPLVFGLEFGDLDPYFFTNFIKSTQEYFPLPLAIYEDYADGVQIIKKMLSLEKFERINSNIENHFGVVVKDRKKEFIEIYKPNK